MLSIILYGRNDNHGYNYQKRLSISLNCLAALLTDPGDEIIFVDYNSSDDLPTAVETIQDTLTDKTKSLLKVFRVRPDHHHRFNTHLPLLEPVARNVGIKRSNPANKWILSTNVDMIFVPCEERSLSDIVRQLEDGFYLLPRFELPENLWEKFLQRSHPESNLQFLRNNAPQLHLNTIVRKKGFLQFDNPGDFQLMLRKDLFDIGGFDEEMLKGWHVDANLSKRMLLNGKTGRSLEKVLWGYHCNHTLTPSLLHTHSRIQNDWNKFVEGKQTGVKANSEGWGLEKETIERVILNKDEHLRGITEGLKPFKSISYEIYRDVEFYNHVTYDPPRIFAFICDHLCNIPKIAQIAYFGFNSVLLEMLGTYLRENHFDHPNVIQEIDGSNAFVYIFDFGFDGNAPIGKRTALKTVMKPFIELMKRKESLNPNTKFIGINIHYSDFMLLFLKHLSVRLTSHIAGCAYGYLKSNEISAVSITTLKKKMILNIGYFVLRFFFKYSESMSRWMRRRKNAK